MTWVLQIGLSVLAALLKSFLEQRQAALDAHQVGELTETLKWMERGQRALAWKLQEAADPADDRDLRVRPDATHDFLPRRDAGDDHQADPSAVPGPEHPDR